jgi:hypothetical protein
MWNPDPSDMQNAPNFGAMSPQAPSVPQTNPAAWNSDFSGQLQQMIAPYQQMAKQYGNSGYAALPGNSWLAQAHPGIARPLDSALLAVAMTKPGQTIGENISNVAGGIVGAQGYRRQQMMQSAMLPYELAEPRLKMMDTMAQMQQRGAMTQAELARIPLDRAMTQRAMDQGDWYARRMQEPNATELDSTIIQRKLGITDVNKMTPEQATAFQTEMEAMRQRNVRSAGLTPAVAAQMQLDAKTPEEIAAADRAAKIVSSIYGSVAGQQAGARSGAEQPFKDVDTEAKAFVSGYKDIKPMPETAWSMQQMMAGQPFDANARAQYEQHINDLNNRTHAATQATANRYRQWAKRNPGKSMDDFLNSPDSNAAPQTGRPTSGGAAPSAPTTNPYRQ